MGERKRELERGGERERERENQRERAARPVGTAASEPEFAAAMQVLAGRELLRSTTERLCREGVRVVALKGVVISALAEGHGLPPRPMLDVDVLVPATARGVAERSLSRAGLSVRVRTVGATTFLAPGVGLDLDLHVRLTEPGLFHLDERAILARACPADALFGFAALMPEPYDLYVHLVAHFVQNRSNARDVRRLRDLEVVPRLLGLESAHAAARLEDAGLGRAARYALALVAEGGDFFSRQVLAALKPDLLGDRLARMARVWLRTRAGNDPAALPVPHLLNASTGRAVRSFADHVGRGASRRIASLADGRGSEALALAQYLRLRTFIHRTFDRVPLDDLLHLLDGEADGTSGVGLDPCRGGAPSGGGDGAPDAARGGSLCLPALAHPVSLSEVQATRVLRRGERLARRLGLRPTTCLFTALGRYAFLRANGDRPVFRMGIDPAEPAHGHAWVELAGVPFLEPPEALQGLTPTYSSRDQRPR